MIISMEKWYNASKERVSVRRFSESASKDELRELKEAAAELSGSNVRIVVGKKKGVFDPLIGRSVSGTETFAAVLTKSADDDYLAGSAGEAFVLECTSMGIGTCWLGLSYSKSVLNNFISFRDDYEKVRCVIAIGHYDELPKKKTQRKTIYDLTGLVETAYKKVPEWQRTAVECGRNAPSARNAQPWEFDILNDSIQIAQVSRNFGYGALDCGIAMLHIEIGAAHCGVYGDWVVEDALATFKVDYNA